MSYQNVFSEAETMITNWVGGVSMVWPIKRDFSKCFVFQAEANDIQITVSKRYR